MEKQVINTASAPAPIGPYSQAVQTGNLLFISGQVALEPVTSQMVNGDITVETSQVMRNLQAILSAASLDFSHVVKTTIFLSDMSLFEKVNETYNTFFKSEFPARETVAVKGLPKNANVEISMIAAK
ncbi:MAG: Rid family detoxifying hydrolase [Ginsengibacter sp.]